MLLENAESTNKRYYSILNSPIGKIVVEDNDQHFSHPRTLSLSNDKNNKTPMFSSAKTYTDKLMPNCGIFILQFLTIVVLIIIVFFRFSNICDKFTNKNEV